MGKELSLSGALPNSSAANGLLDMVGELLKNPRQQRIAVVSFDVDSIKHKMQDDTEMVTVRLRAIEAINDEERVKRVQLVMGDIRMERTGERELALEYGDDAKDGDDGDDED